MPTRRPIDLSNPLPGIMPWGGRSSEYKGGSKQKTRESLHYRGWTLVDNGGWRYASKGDRRILVCRDRVEHSTAMRQFREKVDARESEL